MYIPLAVIVSVALLSIVVLDESCLRLKMVDIEGSVELGASNEN